jgi:hypothetical protein
VFMMFNTTFKIYYSYIVAVSFNGGGNRSTQNENYRESNAQQYWTRTHNFSGLEHTNLVDSNAQL